MVKKLLMISLLAVSQIIIPQHFLSSGKNNIDAVEVSFGQKFLQKMQELQAQQVQQTPSQAMQDFQVRLVGKVLLYQPKLMIEDGQQRVAALKQAVEQDNDFTPVLKNILLFGCNNYDLIIDIVEQCMVSKGLHLLDVQSINTKTAFVDVVTFLLNERAWLKNQLNKNGSISFDDIKQQLARYIDVLSKLVIDEQAQKIVTGFMSAIKDGIESDVKLADIVCRYSEKVVKDDFYDQGLQVMHNIAIMRYDLIKLDHVAQEQLDQYEQQLMHLLDLCASSFQKPQDNMDVFVHMLFVE